MARPGRPRSFDEREALDQIMEVYWHHGYRATTMSQLAGRVGVLPGSLYAALGDKRTLFVTALKRYSSAQHEFAQSLAVADPVIPALRRALGDVLRAAVDVPGRGCLLGNSAVDLEADDDVVRHVVAAAFRDLEQSIVSALERAKTTGELIPTLDSSAHARLIVALMQGLHVLARTEPDPTRLADVVDAALEPLVGPPRN